MQGRDKQGAGAPLRITETLAGSGRLAPPFVPTFGPSRRLLAHPPRRASGSASEERYATAFLPNEFRMTELEITSTSRDSAVASDLVIRDGERVRLIFRPELVNNEQDPSACVRGRFIYQKKRKNAKWEDENRRALSRLGTNEEYQLEIRSGELLQLLRDLGSLYRYGRAQGIPKGQVHLVKLERRLAQLLDLSDEALTDLLNRYPEDGVQALHRLLDWLGTQDDITDFLRIEPARLPALTSLIGLAAVNESLEFWEESKLISDEAYWQEALEKRSFLLGQLLGYPIVIIAARAYVGGKRVDNRGGGVVDFLAATETTQNAVLVEIKTPTTQLLGGEYRTGVFPPSREVSGAVAQVLDYRARLLSTPQVFAEDGEVGRNTSEPRAVILAGNSSELDSPAKKRSFELHRERLMGVQLITFDELFGRASGILKLLTDRADK